ncbi:MAG TPA: putative lipid II flippase FtsW [Conexibacter sp.]|nr:putative lipid II flippase FtsW [Conexibacter sp.]
MSRAARPAAARRRPQPVEQRMLLTAALMLLAFGTVMVYSASSARNVLQHGSGTQYLVRTVIFAAVGLLVMRLMARQGVELLRRFTPLLLVGSFGLLLLVLVPGIGISVNGARRWIGPGTLSFQPSELMKLALILYAAQFLASNPGRIRTFGGMMRPLVVVTGAAALLVAAEPDLGTALVICMTVSALLVAAGVPLRHLGYLAAGGAVLVLLLALVQPYQQARLTAFLDPWASASSSGFQSVQGQIAIGSGGLFGRGLGESVQKAFFLPEAHTDFILAVIGEELGALGVSAVIALFGLIAWSGLRIARAATGQYAKLLATGLTSLILCQATLNIFVVLGIAPLTGVPLPFISYGPTNLTVMLAAVGLLLNVSAGGRAGLRLVEPARRRSKPSASDRERAAADRDRRRRDGGARRAGAGGRRRAAG